MRACTPSVFFFSPHTVLFFLGGGVVGFFLSVSVSNPNIFIGFTKLVYERFFWYPIIFGFYLNFFWKNWVPKNLLVN